MADTSNRGLGSDNIDDKTKHDIRSAGGSASGGNFAKDPARASKEGKKGADAQPRKAKVEGGRNSRRNS